MHYFATSFHLLLLLGVLLHLTPLANGAPGRFSQMFVGGLSLAGIMSPAAGAQPVDGAVAVQHIQPMSTLPGAPEWTPLPSQTHTMPPFVVQQHEQALCLQWPFGLQSCAPNFVLSESQCNILSHEALRSFKWTKCGCLVDPSSSDVPQYVQEKCVPQPSEQQSCVPNFVITSYECNILYNEVSDRFTWTKSCGCLLDPSSSDVPQYVQDICVPRPFGLQSCAPNFVLSESECNILSKNRYFKWTKCGCLLDTPSSAVAQYVQKKCVPQPSEQQSCEPNFVITELECNILREEGSRCFKWTHCGCLLDLYSTCPPSSASADSTSPSMASVAAAGVAASALLLGGPQGTNDDESEHEENLAKTTQKRKPSLRCSRAASQKAAGIKV